MSRSRSAVFVLCCYAVGLLPVTESLVASTSYSVTPISVPAGTLLGISVNITDLNDSGQVTGEANGQAFIATTVKSTLIPLPPGCVGGFGYAINSAGQVTGFAKTQAGSFQAFTGSTAGSSLIPLPSGFTSSLGFDINASGLVVGNVFSSTGSQSPFIGASVIPLPPNVASAAVYSINASGQVAGIAYPLPPTPGNSTLPEVFIGSGAAMSLIPAPSGLSLRDGVSLNDLGQIAGNVTNGIGHIQAFFGTAAGTALIPLPAGATTNNAGDGKAINNSGVVVGSSDIGPWMWNLSTGTQLLNDLVPSGWKLSVAVTINNPGQILAIGSYNGGSSEYVLLSASGPQLQSVAIDPSSVIGGADGTATITLTGPAPDTGALVTASVTTLWAPTDIDPPIVASIINPITVPSGRSSVDVPVATTVVDFPLTVTVRAKYNDVIKTAKMIVLPPRIATVGPTADARVQKIINDFVVGGASVSSYDSALSDLIAVRNTNAPAGQDIYLAAADHYLVAITWVLQNPQQLLSTLASVPGYEAVKLVLQEAGVPIGSPASVLSIEWGIRGIYDGLKTLGYAEVSKLLQARGLHP